MRKRLKYGLVGPFLYDYGSEGRGFESSRARDPKNGSKDAILADFEPFLFCALHGYNRPFWESEATAIRRISCPYLSISRETLPGDQRRTLLLPICSLIAEALYGIGECRFDGLIAHRQQGDKNYQPTREQEDDGANADTIRKAFQPVLHGKVS